MKNGRQRYNEKIKKGQWTLRSDADDRDKWRRR